MNLRWTMIVASALAVLAMPQNAGAEPSKISCADVPYKVKNGLVRVYPKCTVQQVSDAKRTYAVYRDVTVSSPDFARIIVVYKAGKGRFDANQAANDEATMAMKKKVIMGLDGMAWAFEGILERRPTESEIVSMPGYPTRFEARVKALGGKSANCYPTSKYPEPASALEGSLYAVALGCIAKDSHGEWSEDAFLNTLWNLEWAVDKEKRD